MEAQVCVSLTGKVEPTIAAKTMPRLTTGHVPYPAPAHSVDPGDKEGYEAVRNNLRVEFQPGRRGTPNGPGACRLGVMEAPLGYPGA